MNFVIESIFNQMENNFLSLLFLLKNNGNNYADRQDKNIHSHRIS